MKGPGVIPGGPIVERPTKPEEGEEKLAEGFL